MKNQFTTIVFLAGAVLGSMPLHAEETMPYSVQQYQDDALTTQKVRTAFARDKWVRGLAINVRTERGIVDLNGTVNRQNQSDRAAQLASTVESVIGVNNKLTVMPR